MARLEKTGYNYGLFFIFTFWELTTMQKMLALLSFIMVIDLLAGCANTTQGAGRDIENMGEWVQETF